MKSVEIKLPDKLAEELDKLIKEGWFMSQEEVLRVALMEFVRRHEFKLIERFQREDIEWAAKQKETQEG